MQPFSELATVVEQPDPTFKERLPAALEGVEDDLERLLLEQPDTFEALAERVSTLEGIADYATEETETVERFLAVLWDGLGLVADVSPAVQDAITDEYAVTWECEDAPIAFHARTDPDAGSLAGGPGALEDPEITFRGPAETMFSTLQDEDFNAVLAFVQNRLEVVGSVQRARAFDAMMDSVTGEMEDLEPAELGA